jgi:predicted O-methyltransferase YrrM
LAYWRGRRARLEGAREREFRPGEHLELVREDAAAALAELTGEAADECVRAIGEAWVPPAVADDPAPWWPRESLARLVGAATSLTEATTVLEVGVARGYSSAAILAALEANVPEGRLHSIDLPPLDVDAEEFVGAAVPERHRGRWALEAGPSSAILPRLASRIEPIALFVHDGDHSYRSQHEDLATVWPHLSPGAIAIVDDVWTTAAIDFAAEAGAAVLVLEPPGERDGIAMLRKPG